jgi:hypothetical protein
VQIELLYFDDCPSWQTALEHLLFVLAEIDPETDVRLIQVETDDEAITNRFVGSPTIRVEGADLFPTNSADYALGCRVFATPDGIQGWPTADMIRTALTQVGA